MAPGGCEVEIKSNLTSSKLAIPNSKYVYNKILDHFQA